MDNRPADTVSHDLGALFSLGVVAAMSDEQLLEHFAARTESDGEIAFEAIVRRHGPMVMGVCRRLLGNQHDAEDAFQATFIVLALRVGAVRKRQSLGPWLHGVAARICGRARLVTRRRREASLPAEGLSDDRGHDPALADLHQVLDEELRRLPEKYRRPIVLCYLEGRSQEDAARELGWTKGTISGRLARAKGVLQHRLIRRGLAPAAALVATSFTLRGSAERRQSEPPLLAATVRTATLASFSGLKTGSMTVEVGTLVRLAVRALFLGRVARLSTLVLALGLGASAIATQIIGPTGPDRRGDADRTALALAGLRKTEPTPRLDRFGDPLPAPIMMRFGTIQRRHTARVVGVSFTRDRNSALTAQADGLVRFWNVERGSQERIIDVTAATPAVNKSIRQVATSRDGRYLAAVGLVRSDGAGRPAGKLWILSLPDSSVLRTIDTNTMDPQCLAFSPDGTIIATGEHAGELKLWNTQTGECFKTTKLVENQPVFALAFAPDGKTLATNQIGKGVVVWHLNSGETERIAMPSIDGAAPFFSDDGRYLATSTRDGESTIWDRRTSQRHCVSRGFAQGFTPDGNSLAVIRPVDGSIALIDTETGRDRWKTVLGPALEHGGLAFAPDGTTMIVGWDNVLRVFETVGGRERFESDGAHRGAVSAISYTPDGRTAITAGNDGTIRQWDAASGRQLRVMSDALVAQVLAISPDGTTLASTSLRAPENAPAFRVWDLTNGRLRREYQTKTIVNGPKALAFSTDGKRVLFYAHSLGLKVVNVASGEEQPAVQPRFVLGPDEAAELNLAAIGFAPGNRYLAIYTGAVHVAELEIGVERFSCPGYAMAFTPDGQNLAVANQGDPSANHGNGATGMGGSAVEIVEIATGARKRIAAPVDRVAALAFSPDARILAVALGWRESRIRLYSVENLHEIDTFVCPATRTHPGALAFAPDSRGLAVGLDDTTAVIFNVGGAR